MRGGGVGPEGVTWRRKGQPPAVASSAARSLKTADSCRRPGSDPCARPTATAKRDVLKDGVSERETPDCNCRAERGQEGRLLAFADAVAGEAVDLDVLASLGAGRRHDLRDG